MTRQYKSAGKSTFPSSDLQSRTAAEWHQAITDAEKEMEAEL